MSGEIAIKQQALWAAIETTYGTLVTPAATDVLKVSNLQVNRAENLNLIERPNIKETFGPDQALYGGALFGFTFDVECKGSGAAGTVPRLGKLLRACGLSETIVASTSVTYEPSSDVEGHESVSIFYKEGPNLRKASGCRGNVSFNAAAGKQGMFSFTFLGHIGTETVAAAPAITHETTVPQAFKDAAFSVGAFETAIESLAFDVGNTFAAGPDPNTTDSFGDIIITDRDPTGSFNPEARSIAVKDWVGIFRANTLQAITTGVVGATAGNRWALTIPKAYFKEVGQGDRNALLVYEISFGAAETSGDDSFALAFT